MKRDLFLLGTLLAGSLWVAQSWADESKTLTCYSTVYQPYVMDTRGNISGIDADVVREIGRRLGRDIQIKLEPWRRLEKALKAGKRDCVFSYFHTERRDDYALFTGVPMHVTQYTLFYDPEKFPAAHGLNDFLGQTIGVNRGFNTTPEFHLAKAQSDIEVVEVNEDSQSLKMLELGRIDAVLTNYDVGQYLIRVLGLSHLRALEPPLSTTPAYLVLRRSPELEPLIERFNWALFQILTDGTYARIRARYIGFDDSTQSVPIKKQAHPRKDEPANAHSVISGQAPGISG